MEILLDSANIAQIRALLPYFPIDGFTTNPSILSKDSDDVKKTLTQLLELSDGNRPDSPYTDLYRQYEQRMHELADILMRRDNRNRGWDGGTMNRVDNTGIRQERPASAPTAMGGETWVCPSCGAQSSGKFCANCGTAKPVVSSGCTNCGWRPSAGQGMPKFCPECGRPLQ